MKLTDLPNWDNMKKDEKSRLRKVYGKEAKFTSKMISSKELKKFKKDG